MLQKQSVGGGGREGAEKYIQVAHGQDLWRLQKAVRRCAAGRMNHLLTLAAALTNSFDSKTFLLKHCIHHQLHFNPPPPPPPLLPQMAYKPWLCAQFFPTARRSCKQKVPCHQYCLEVQQSCPFILPDNDDLIHGGSPSFICTGQSVVPNSLPVCVCGLYLLAGAASMKSAITIEGLSGDIY